MVLSQNYLIVLSDFPRPQNFRNMKSVTVILILAACAPAILAQGPEMKFALASKSGTNDDDISEAICSEKDGFLMVQCTCILDERDWLAYRPCDGSFMTTNKYGETVCRAYNQAWGAGVEARAYCAKLFTTVRSDLDLEVAEATCPAGYEMVGCNMHSFHAHQMRDGDGNVSYAFEPDYAANTCKARCPKGAHTAGEVLTGDLAGITMVKETTADMTGCMVTAQCYWADPSSIPVFKPYGADE